MPSTNMMTPTRNVIVNRACGIWLLWIPAFCRTLPVASAMALVSVLIIRIVPVLSDDTMTATIPE